MGKSLNCIKREVRRQEESRNISLNTTWGQRKRFADGKINLPYKAFLGYEKGPDGLPQIVEEQAKIVRLIYQLFLEGKTPTGIARYLTSCNIPTPASRKNWTGSTVTSVSSHD
ncbi:MAG TPA: recombinase family protein [Caproicibacter sp.]|nr:recombinase family protein [Caproicibacter sp.]